ncbi:MAG TPA: site-specific DNA-methyltransferase, partial [Chloroflexi bacterium]|nr:site-specific DNA-methyltransferase [Chloroflexota bacterium]
ATFKSSKKAGFGKVPDLERGKVPEDWWYFPVVARLHQERTGYPTQKPERLLERIILASTNPDGLVADFFCGAGTTGTVANRLNRRFILSDLQNRAIITSRSRLVLKNQELGENRAELEGPALPVYLQREEGRMEFPLKSLEEMGFPEISIEAGVIHLPPELVPNVDYWEVDPDWQGKVFRSRYQAVRPLRKGDLPSSMILPEAGGKICLRIVLISGEQIQQVLN